MHRSLCVALACASSALAQPAAPDVKLSIFRPDLSIVSETVAVDLAAGQSTLRLDFLRGNADLVTLQVFVLDHPADVAIIGQTRKNELPNAVFLEVDAKNAGSERFELRYAARGFSATPSYVATFDAAARTLDLVEELEVSNDSGESLPLAKVDALFGEVKTVGSTPVTHGRAPDPQNADPGLPSQPLVKDLAEHAVVTFGERVALADGVASRLRVLDLHAIPAAIEYRFRAEEAGGRVTRKIKVKNTTDEGLKGQTLQPGRMTLTEREPGGAERFLSWIDVGALAPGQDLELALGVADDLFVERDRLDQQRLDLEFGEYNRALVSYTEEEAFRLKLRNHSTEPRTLTVVESVGGTETFEVLESSSPAERKDRNTLEFKVEIAAGAEGVLTYRVKKTNLKAG